MNQVGNDHLAFNSIVTPNHNREFFRDDHNKSIKSNEGFFEMDNIFGSRDNSEDKEKQFFGIPLKQKNKYQDSINLNKMDDGGYYNNHKSSNNIDNFRMSPNMPGLTNFDNNPQQ